MTASRSTRFLPRCRPVLGALLALATAGGAGAASLDFGVAYRSGGATLLDTAWARLGVSELSLLGGTVAAGVSSRAADLGYARSLALPPLGAATVQGDLAVTYRGGVRAATHATASLGPVALRLGGSVFTTPATSIDPLAAWTEAPTDLREQGWTADLSARYRVSRNLVAVLGGEFGPQNHGQIGVEGRRELTRPLPPAEGDDPAAPPETEPVGTVSWRLGARAGSGVLAATAGLGYATPDGLSVTVDGLLGAEQLGLGASLSAPDVLGSGSALRLYAAFEPWRLASSPLRAGLAYSVPVGPGVLGVQVSGGRSATLGLGIGARLNYALSLDAPAAPEPDSPAPGMPEPSTPEPGTPDGPAEPGTPDGTGG